jgi:hypothetical protein
MANSCQRLARSARRASSSKTRANADAAIGPAADPGQLDLDPRSHELDAQLGEPIAHRRDDRRGLVEQLTSLDRIALQAHERQHAQR